MENLSAISKELHVSEKVIKRIWDKGMISLLSHGSYSLMEVLIELREETPFGYLYEWISYMMNTDHYTILSKYFSEYLDRQFGKLTKGQCESKLIANLAIEYRIPLDQLINKSLWSRTWVLEEKSVPRINRAIKVVDMQLEDDYRCLQADSAMKTRIAFEKVHPSELDEENVMFEIYDLEDDGYENIIQYRVG